MNELTTENVSADKPYPRRCTECGEVAVRPAKIAYNAKIKHDGKLFHLLMLPQAMKNSALQEKVTNALGR